MRLKTRTWLLFSLLLLSAAVVLWQMGEKVNAPRRIAPEAVQSKSTSSTPSMVSTQSAFTNGYHLKPVPRFSNTPQTAAQLAHNEHGLILRNVLLDTAKPVKLAIPAHLRSHGAPGSYIVQSDRALNAEFYATLAAHGARYVAYLPNNAALVQATPEQARALVADPAFQAVLPYEPYFKLDEALLPEAVNQTLMANNQLRVTTFPGQRDAALHDLQALGANLEGEDETPFGPTLIVNVPPDKLVAVAQLPSAWDIEAFSPRRALNDLTRVRLGVSTNTLIPTPNYLGLSGQGIWLGLNDTGVDQAHPDFGIGRLFGDSPAALVDTNGHGTHVAGTMIGSGSQSAAMTNLPPGSVTNASFRGMATNADLYVQRVDMVTGPYVSDSYLQTNGWLALSLAAAAHAGIVTNGFIVNNSWGYQSTFYDLMAASWDQAVRDAEPGIPGEQSLLPVFAAGDRGTGANPAPDSITSPGTLKNGITVGAIDSPRFITNTVTLPGLTNYAIFESDTFDSNEVAGFSSGGNVDVGIEGASGRFKPDVVAPGVFTVSTRSKDFADPAGDAVLFYLIAPGQTLPPGTTNFYSMDVAANTTNVTLQLSPNDLSPVPFPGNLQVYFDQVYPPVTPLTTTNAAGLLYSFNPAPGVYNLAIVNPGSAPQPVNFDLKIYAITNGPYGVNFSNSYYGVLSNLNSLIGPSYRYETGTSMAAAAVSGLLGLVQQYLIANLHIMPSPALLKALLINGSSALNSESDFNPAPAVNLAGWGLPNLADILPASLATTPTLWFTNQSPANALQTGQWQNYTVNLDPSDTNAANYPLRITLVWTDPPGNPAAGIALVNDLALVVTDAQGNVYVGNNFFQGDVFTEFDPSTNTPAAADVINNVQNVYIDASFGLLPPYTVSVGGTRVNVNAVTGQTNAIEQDYALVISSDDPAPTAALTVTPLPLVTTNVALVTVVSDAVPLLHQRVGANEPNLYYNSATNAGADNTNGNVFQWHFFLFTNTVTATNGLYTNAVFTTFLPPSLTFPNSTPANLSVPAANNADIDLYVSTDPGLLTLNPAAVAQSSKSLNRGGNETVFWTNTTQNQVFYIGVKSETQQGSDFAFFAEVTTNFDSVNGLNPVIVSGAPVPAEIPDSYLGSTAAYVIAVVASPVIARKVAVEVGLEHSNPADVIGSVTHNAASATLNHYTGPPGGFTNIYDDLPDGSSQQIFHATTQPSDGPGSLRNFVGQPASGSFILAESDAAPTQVGAVTALTVAVWPQPPNPLLFTTTLPPYGWYFGYVDVPDDATNLNIAIGAYNPQSGGPAGIYITNQDFVGINDYGVDPIPSPGGSLDVPNPLLNVPPASTVNLPSPLLGGGRWFYGITNESAAPLTVTVAITIAESLTPNLNVTEANNTVTPLLTGAHTQSQICIDSGLLTNNQQLVSLNVGVRLDDTNLDDLVLTLTSPQGTSVELFENRGGTNATQLGLTDTNGNLLYTTFTDNSNLASTLVKFVPPPYAQPISAVNLISNSFETVELGEVLAAPSNWAVATLTNDINYSITNHSEGDYGTTNAFFPVFSNSVEGWLVESNNVSVESANNLYTTPSGTNFLALAAGTLTQTIPTVIGQAYALTNLYRGPGLVDWWPFEGDASDLIGTNNGTISGNITNVWGVVGQGFMFNGSNSQINFGANVANFGTNDFTIEYWMWSTNQNGAGGGGMDFLTKGSQCNANPTSYLTISDDTQPLGKGFIQLVLAGNSMNSGIAGPELNDGIWHHVAWERRSRPLTATLWIATLFLYVDGKYYTANSFGDLVNFNNSSPLLLGGPGCVTGSSFNGAVDEFSIWNRALTDAEIAAIYSAGTNHVGKATTNSIFPNINYQVNGATVTNVIAPPSSTNWFTNILYFTAVSTTTTISIQGNPLGMLLDDFILTGPTNANYVLPEESLAALNGQNPYGCWTLDVWDTRVDSALPNNGTLFSWNLQMTVSSTNVNLVVLTNAIAYTNGNVPGNSITYFAFDVPAGANFVTNTLTNNSGIPLNLLFNQANLPTGTQPGDYLLLANITTNAAAVLTNDAPAPSFLRATRYFLGVQNPNATPATFTLEAQTDQLTAGTNIIVLSNNIPSFVFLTSTNTLTYFSFFVPTNAVLAYFNIYEPQNAVTLASLYVANGLPLPSSMSYDYAVNAPSTTNINASAGASIIVTTNSFPLNTPFVTANSIPVPLTPGNWYLTLQDEGIATNRSYAIYITAAYETYDEIGIVSLTNAVPFNFSSFSRGFPSPPPPPTNYYSFTIANSPSSVLFTLTNAVTDDDIELIARDGALPTPQQMTLGSFNVGTGFQTITIVTNSELPSLNGTWYLGVPINNLYNEINPILGYSILATTSNVRGTNNFPAVVFSGLSAPSLTNGFAMNWQSVPGSDYEVDLTTNLSLSAWITATNFTATNTITTFSDPTPIGTQAARFYRVIQTQ